MEDTSKQPNCDLKCFARKNIAKDLSLLHEAVKDLYLNFETFIKKQDSQEQSFFDPQSSPRFRKASIFSRACKSSGLERILSRVALSTFTILALCQRLASIVEAVPDIAISSNSAAFRGCMEYPS